jgi:hypothetical protein
MSCTAPDPCGNLSAGLVRDPLSLQELCYVQRSSHAHQRGAAVNLHGGAGSDRVCCRGGGGGARMTTLPFRSAHLHCLARWWC